MKYVYKSNEPLLNEINDTNVYEDSVAFWNLGQSGVLIKGAKGQGVICIDPYLTYNIEEVDPDTEFVRAFAPPLQPEMLQGIDGLLATHHHGDHLDLATIGRLHQVSIQTKFVIPKTRVSMVENIEVDMDQVIQAQQEQSFTINGFTITPIPAAHTEYKTDQEGNHVYLGYLIEVNGVRLFHSGDTIVTKDLIERVKTFQPDVVFLPINGGDYFRTARAIIGNMTFREAADFGNEVGADLIIPVHYDLFPNNRDNPSYFVDYLFHHYPAQKYHMLTPGERFVYVK